MLDHPASWIPLALGGVLLFFGRRLYWLIVAAAGFGLGLLLADAWLTVDSEAARVLVGLLAGALAAIAAVFLQRVAIGVAGAFIAGYATWWYLSLTWAPLSSLQWLLVVAAAVVGLLLARAIFELGLVLLSSIAGATLILDSLAAGAETSRWLYLVLVVVGVAVQASSLGSSSRKS